MPKASCCAACARRWERRFRSSISLDYHANVTPQMVELTDALIAYRTYPHVDRVETGQHAARAMERAARARPARRAARCARRRS